VPRGRRDGMGMRFSSTFEEKHKKSNRIVFLNGDSWY
jgi:hypothetical protein